MNARHVFAVGLGRPTPCSLYDNKACKMSGSAVATMLWIAQRRSFKKMIFAQCKKDFFKFVVEFLNRVVFYLEVGPR
jgi:hypothetical protein